MDAVLEAICDDEPPAQASSVVSISKLNDNCNKLLFSDLCKNFETVERTSGSARKFSVIFNKNLLNHLAGQSVFPLMRLVLPSIDSERGKYGLKQTSIAKAYVSALHLDATRSEDAKRLLNWKVS